MITKLNKDTVISADLLINLIGKHKSEITRLNNLNNHYKNKAPIVNRSMKDKSKPNNKLVNNYARYITTMATGYFIGIPVTINSENKELLTRLEAIYKYNDEADVNTTLATTASKFGYAYELHYLDETASIRFTSIDPRELIYVVDTCLTGEPIMAIRYFKLDTDKESYYVEVYDTSWRTEYILNEDSLIEKNKEAHNFKDVPVIRYDNNDDNLGDYESVISLIDAYNKAQSDTANDFEYFTDAYLKVTGTTLDKEEAADLKELRVFNFPDTEGDVSFVTKEMNDTALENYKDRIDKDIHKFAMVPNMTDENFAGNASGVAMAYKLQGLEFLTGVKEQKFKKGLLRRVELITNILSIKMNKELLFTDIGFTFTRNNPKNLVEIVQMTTDLTGIISEESQLDMLPMINTEQELKRKEAEKAAAFESIDLYNFNDNGADINE